MADSSTQDQAQTGRFTDVLANSVFRYLWIASVVSTMGTSMHDIGAAWLMTELAPSPIFVSLVQACSTLPIFLLSIPSGALADIVGRRELLLISQAFMLCIAAALGAATLAHFTNPPLLLTLTFLLAVGNAMNIPPWQSLTADLVERNNLQRGIVLQSVGSNIARAVGPALGGLAVAQFGAGWVFMLNALSFAGVVLVLLRWKPVAGKSTLPAQRFISAVRSCLAYSVHSPELTTVLLRTGGFVFFSCAAIALLPLIIRKDLHQGPEALGFVLAFNGAGALLTAPFVKKLKKNPDLACWVATLGYAVALVGMAFIEVVPVMCLCLLLAGASWLVVNSTLNTATQVSSPAWVRARAVSVQQLVFFGAIALGSIFWGALATWFHTRTALLFCATGLLISSALLSRKKLAPLFNLQLDYSEHWGEIHMDHTIPLDQGPVLMRVEYEIDTSKIDEFREAMRALRNSRFRSGALRWELYQDVSDKSRFWEIFLTETWGDHLRQHEHVPLEDKIAEEKVRAFHIGSEVVRGHFVYDKAIDHFHK